jgi:hypothetical protein
MKSSRHSSLEARTFKPENVTWSEQSLRTLLSLLVPLGARLLLRPKALVRRDLIQERWARSAFSLSVLPAIDVANKDSAIQIRNNSAFDPASQTCPDGFDAFSVLFVLRLS